MTAHYPVFLDLEKKPCLVVGGGKVAERKIRSLLKAGADVLCVSDQFNPGIAGLIRKGVIRGIRKRLSGREDFSRWIRKAFLVIGATSSPRINAQVYDTCRRRNLLVNVVDDPDHSNFIAPAVLSRGRLAIAISTGGASPQFAKTIREKMEGLFGPEYSRFLNFMARERRRIMARIQDPAKRRKFFEDLVRSGILSLFTSGDRRAIRKKYAAILTQHGIAQERKK